MTRYMISLFDLSTETCQPWANAGYTCIAVDMQHPESFKVERYGRGRIITTNLNVYDVTLDDFGGLDIPTVARIPVSHIDFVAAYPPCTDLAGSGARWWKEKAEVNPDFQREAVELVKYAAKIAEGCKAPYFIENPVGALTRLWRKWDHTFQPHNFARFADTPFNEAYTKRTCLWTGGGFVMPDKEEANMRPVHGSKLHRLGPSPERANLRSKTPQGFARAIFCANNVRFLNQLSGKWIENADVTPEVNWSSTFMAS